MLNNKKSCSGRSMVELIAVFAVLSALILGGVLGFLYFRDKNTANNVLKEALVQASEA